MIELNRFLRHLIAPLVMWLVAKGYLPEYMHGDVTEAVVIVLAFAIPFALSKYREHR